MFFGSVIYISKNWSLEDNFWKIYMYLLLNFIVRLNKLWRSVLINMVLFWFLVRNRLLSMFCRKYLVVMEIVVLDIKVLGWIIR